MELLLRLGDAETDAYSFFDMNCRAYHSMNKTPLGSLKRQYYQYKAPATICFLSFHRSLR